MCPHPPLGRYIDYDVSPPSYGDILIVMFAPPFPEGDVLPVCVCVCVCVPTTPLRYIHYDICVPTPLGTCMNYDVCAP